MDQLLQPRRINAIAIAVNRGVVDIQPIKAGASGAVVGDMTANACGRHNDAIARLAQRHKAVKIGNRAGWHANFGVLSPKDVGGQGGGDNLYLFNGF